MKRFNPERSAAILALGMSSLVLVAFSTAAAQVAPKKIPVKVPVKAAPVKPAPAKPMPPAAAPAKPAAAAPQVTKPVVLGAKPVTTSPVATNPTAAGALQKAATPGQTASGAVVPASSQTVLPATAVGQSQAASSNLMPARSAAGATPGTAAVAGDPRSAVATQGLGTFLGGGWTMTAYGCFRTGTRVLCDFDVLPPRNTGINAGAFGPWVALVDDGGKITAPHNAFFQAADGSQLTTAYADTSNPLRLLMEYDNVSPNFNSVALVHGADRIPGVPITPADPNQPAGTIQARGAAPASGAAPVSGADTSAVDKASNGISTATGKIQDTKGKAQSLIQQMKDAATAVKH
jgi:hypothetical protein